MQLAGLYSLTIEASLLTGCILLIRKVFEDRIHPMVLKCLWGLLAIRILIPVQLVLEGDFEQPFSSDWRTIGMLLWLAGIIVFFLFFLIKNIRFHFMIKHNRTLYGKKDGLLVYFVNRKIGSCLVGLLSPKIYISKLASDNSILCNWIVRHELCHYQSKDNWYGMIRNLCLLIQWFNPLIWYAALCSVEDFEIVCDYQVLQEEDKQAQLAYGKCLVALSAKNPTSYVQNITTGVSLNKGNLKRRIEKIKKQSHGSTIENMLLLTAMLIITLCCFCAPKNPEHPLCTVMERLPYFNNYVIRYELEIPTKENMEQILSNIQFKSIKYRHEEYKFLQMNQQAIMFFAPVSKMFEGDKEWIKTYKREIEELVKDSQIVIKSDKEEWTLTIEEDTIFELQEGEGYSLWLNTNEMKMLKGLVEPYSIKLGNNVLLSEKDCEIRGEAICIVKDASFDFMYDIKKLLLEHNPCNVSVTD